MILFGWTGCFLSSRRTIRVRTMGLCRNSRRGFVSTVLIMCWKIGTASYTLTTCVTPKSCSDVLLKRVSVASHGIAHLRLWLLPKKSYDALVHLHLLVGGMQLNRTKVLGVHLLALTCGPYSSTDTWRRQQSMWCIQDLFVAFGHLGVHGKYVMLEANICNGMGRAAPMISKSCFDFPHMIIVRISHGRFQKSCNEQYQWQEFG